MVAENQSDPDMQESHNGEDESTAENASEVAVLVVGASAGDLPALRAFFTALPKESGITFVVGVHLSPEDQGVLAEVIQATTSMPVIEVSARLQMRPNYVYMIPPDKQLLVAGDTLELAAQEMPNGEHIQNDLFFRSLAEASGDGTATLHSGTGNDGALGMLALKEHGGMGEALFRKVWESTSDGMSLTDANGMMLAANPAFLTLSGYNAEDIIGQSFALIFPAIVREDARDEYRRIFNSEANPTAFESIVQRADGSQRIIEAHVTFLSVEGQRRVMLSTIRDISERKQAEEELQQLNAGLESRVEERTEQVRGLITQLTMSEQEERRRVSAILHDDLQQRLFSVNFQLATLRNSLSDQLTERSEEILNAISQALRESMQMTRSLSVDLSPPILNDEGLFAALKWLANQMEQQQQLAVTVVADESLPPIDDDLRVLLFQFIRELLFNVVKHANVSSAVVALVYESGKLRLEVSDEGQGFDTKFKGFQNSQGLLRITQRLQLIDGHMEIDSGPGEGTRITLIVPLQEQFRA